MYENARMFILFRVGDTIDSPEHVFLTVFKWPPVIHELRFLDMYTAFSLREVAFVYIKSRFSNLCARRPCSWMDVYITTPFSFVHRWIFFISNDCDEILIYFRCGNLEKSISTFPVASTTKVLVYEAYLGCRHTFFSKLISTRFGYRSIMHDTIEKKPLLMFKRHLVFLCIRRARVCNPCLFTTCAVLIETAIPRSRIVEYINLHELAKLTLSLLFSRNVAILYTMSAGRLFMFTTFILCLSYMLCIQHIYFIFKYHL